MVDFRLGAIELDDQQRLDIARIAGVDEIVGGVDRRPVHHLHAAGNDPRGDDGRHGVAGSFAAREAEQQRPRGFRLLQDPHRDFGDHPQEPFRPGHQAQEVVPFRVQMFAAQADHRAVDQYHFQAQQVVGGQAVFETMDAAGVLRHVAADGTGDLAGGIGRVIETFALYRVGYAQVGHPRLHHRTAVVVIDVQDAVELAQTQEDPIGQGQGAAGKRRARAAGHHLDPLAVTIAEHFGDLPGVFRQHDDQRGLAISGKTVGFVSPQLVLIDDDPFTGNNGAQGRGNLAPGVDDPALGLRHAHRLSLRPMARPLGQRGVGHGKVVIPICINMSRLAARVNAKHGCRQVSRPAKKPLPIGKRLSKPQWIEGRCLPLACLESRVFLVDHVDPTAPTHDPAVLFPQFGGFQRVNDFHGSGPRVELGRSGASERPGK
jgi:hypothetical protein